MDLLPKDTIVSNDEEYTAPDFYSYEHKDYYFSGWEPHIYDNGDVLYQGA